MSEFDKRMSTYKKIAGFMPEKISSDEVAKNNAAVEAITKDQTDAAIAVLSGKNAPQEEKPQNQDFKPFSFENAPVYKSLNQEENSEEDNRREQNRQPENFAQNNQNRQGEQTQPKNASPLIPSIPKPPVNGFGGTAESNGTGGANNFAENFNRNNIPGAQNFQPAQNERPAQAEGYEAGRESGSFGSFGNGGNSAEPNNFSNYQNYQNMPGAVPPNSAQPAPVPYQPVPYQPENGAQNNQNYSPVPYSAQNTENGASAQSFSNYQEQAQALQNQGAQAFANLRSAVDENYKITLQNVVQNQQPPKPEPQAQPAQPEIKPGANPVPYKAVPYMASSPNGELPRYQADDDEPAQKTDRQPEQRQNYSDSQNVRNNVQQTQNAAPKKGFWQKPSNQSFPRPIQTGNCVLLMLVIYKLILMINVLYISIWNKIKVFQKILMRQF